MGFSRQITFHFHIINIEILEGSVPRKPQFKSFIVTYLFKATLRMAGALEKSTEVMSMMQKLVKIPQIQATMMELSKEMMKVSLDHELEAQVA